VEWEALARLAFVLKVVRVWLCLGVLLLRVGSLKERCVEVAVTPDQVCQDLIGGMDHSTFSSLAGGVANDALLRQCLALMSDHQH